MRSYSPEMATIPKSAPPPLDRSRGLLVPEGWLAVAHIDSTYQINPLELLNVVVELDDSYPDSVAEAAAVTRRLLRWHLEDIFEVTTRVPVVDAAE